MALSRLQIHNLRNLDDVALSFSPKYNLFYGDNGSGKTSLLEAIYYLSVARSFRSRVNRHVIQHQADKLTLYAELDGHQLGLQKMRDGSSRIRINGVNQNSAAELAGLLPVLLIHADTYQLITGSSKYRRQFLDWGVFHVEHRFIALWRDVQRIIKQRNHALRAGMSDGDIRLWDESLVDVAVELDQLRQSYLHKLVNQFQIFEQSLLGLEVELNYYPGWSGDLAEQLRTSLQRDRQLGYTQFGPQRADLRLNANKRSVKESFSRGQQKLLFFALKLAQGKLLFQSTDKHCVVLIDDLAAELDSTKRDTVMKALDEMNAQVFVTAVDRNGLTAAIDSEQRQLFHVEHGRIHACESLPLDEGVR